MLYAYFDDSGTHGVSPVVSVGGLIGTSAQWALFNKTWEILLKNPLGKQSLPSFGLSDCRGRRHHFRDYSDAEVDAITHDFRELIKNSGVKAVASAIDKKAWDDLVVGPIRRTMGEAEPFCIVNCVNCALSYATSQGETDVAVFYDQGRESPELHRIRKLFIGQTRTPARIASFEFAFVAGCYPLQGADMTATESYWFAQKWLPGEDGVVPRPHFQSFEEHVQGAGFIMGRHEIECELSRRNPDGTLMRGTPVSDSG
jgi:hypothetical protein